MNVEEKRNASCGNTDSADFFPTSGFQGGKAIALCRACPVRRACMAEGLAEHEYGIWGGLRAKERDQAADAALNPRIERTPEGFEARMGAVTYPPQPTLELGRMGLGVIRMQARALHDWRPVVDALLAAEATA